MCEGSKYITYEPSFKKKQRKKEKIFNKGINMKKALQGEGWERGQKEDKQRWA